MYIMLSTLITTAKIITAFCSAEEPKGCCALDIDNLSRELLICAASICLSSHLSA